MTVIALVGDSPALRSAHAKLSDSPLPFRLVDDTEIADVLITDAAAPASNYLGVAAADCPDTFFCRDESVDYVVAAVTEAHIIGAHGVRVRRPVQDRPSLTQHGFLRRKRRADPLDAFDPVDYDWATAESDDSEIFDDEVVLILADEEISGRLRARGFMDTNDGKFHWAGILHCERARELKNDGKSKAKVQAVDGSFVAARIAEITQWGTVRVTGVGNPPWQPTSE